MSEIMMFASIGVLLGVILAFAIPIVTNYLYDVSSRREELDEQYKPLYSAEGIEIHPGITLPTRTAEPYYCLRFLAVDNETGNPRPITVVNIDLLAEWKSGEMFYIAVDHGSHATVYRICSEEGEAPIGEHVSYDDLMAQWFPDKPVWITEEDKAKIIVQQGNDALRVRGDLGGGISLDIIYPVQVVDDTEGKQDDN